MLTQNHLGLSTNLTLWSQQCNRRDLTLKDIAHASKILVKFFNWISYSDPSYTCTNSQYLSQITSFDLMILTLAMAAVQKQMWGHRPEHSHTQLINSYTGLYTFWSNELSAWYARSWAHHIYNLTFLYQQWINGGLLTWTTALPCHLISTITQNKHTLWITKVNHRQKPPSGGFSSHSDWPPRSLWP